MIETIGVLLVVGFLLPLLGCYLLRKKNKKMEKECYNANVEKVRAIKGMNIAQNEAKEYKDKGVIRTFLILQKGGITPETEIKRFNDFVKEQDWQTTKRGAESIVDFSKSTAGLLPKFEEILAGLREKKQDELRLWLEGNREPIGDLTLLGLKGLKDIEDLCLWAEEKYSLATVGEESQN